MHWSGHHWQMDNIGDAHFAQADVEGVAEVYMRTADHYRLLARQAEDEGDKEAAGRLKKKCEALKARVNKLRSRAGRFNCLHFAKTNRDSPLAIGGDEIDCEPWLLPMANGVLDLKTGLLRPGRPEDYLMKASPVEWQGIDAPCPQWDKCLTEVMVGDE